MTQAEFYAAQKAARNKWLEISLGIEKELSRIYIDAANEVADKIKTLEANRKGSNLTSKSLKQLEKTLRDTGQRIAQGTENITIDSINKTVNINNEPHIQYINDAIDISQTNKISATTIQQMYATVNTRIVELTYSRIWEDGYIFSDRIWGNYFPAQGKTMLGLAYWWQKNIKDVVLTGFAQNRDVLQIAKDIQVYAAKGKIKLMKRYGELVRGTAAFANRIPKKIDWRALRIARSELYNSIQEQAKLQGQFNPAVQEYRWNLTSGAEHDCICPDLAADSPYREGEVPDYPHVGCLCYITHVIKSRDEFVQDIIDWGKGAVIPYLENWYTSVYIPFLG